MLLSRFNRPFMLKLPKKAWLLCLLMLGSIHSVGAQELIVNAKVGIDSLKLKELRALYAMRRSHWPDGTAVHLVVYSNDNVLHREFTKEMLAVFPHQLQNRWDKLVYSGRAAPPMRVGSEAEMVDFVSRTPGAIGYISQGEPAGVKVVPIAK